MKQLKDEADAAFEALWEKITATKKLPEMAELLMPQSFSPNTRQDLVTSSLSADEIADLLNRVIDAINSGATERIDDLLQKELQK